MACLADSKIRSPLLINISETILRAVSFIPFSDSFRGLCTCADKGSEPQQYRVKMAEFIITVRTPGPIKHLP